MVGAERREEAEQQRALLGIVANALSLLHDACVTEETKRTKAYDEIYSRTRRNLKSTSTSRTTATEAAPVAASKSLDAVHAQHFDAKHDGDHYRACYRDEIRHATRRQTLDDERYGQGVRWSWPARGRSGPCAGRNAT